MQTMSDKEFDKLFKDKFDSFEINPSPVVWDGIENKLENRQKKPFPFFSAAAASMAAIVAVSLWLMPEKKPIRLYGKVKPAVVSLSEGVNEDNNIESNDVVLPIVSAPSEDYVKVSKRRSKRRIVISAPEEQVNAPVTQSFVASVEEKQTEQKIEESPILVTSIAEISNTRSMLALKPLPEEEKINDEERVKSKIKTVGDLVNFVVRKVDKRKNKIIEFSKEDEGDVVSGLNLGLVQYKTRVN